MALCSESGARRLRFFGDDFAIAPDVNRCAMHSRGFARNTGGTAESTANGCGKWSQTFRFSFHGPCSFSTGSLPELSYTVHASASGR